MKRTILAVRVATAIAVLAIAASGCAKKVTSVNPDYTQVEGVSNPDVHLVVWPDLPNTLTDYARETVPNTTPAEVIDVIRDARSIYAVGAHAQRLAVLDGSTAGAFQLFRRESGGGFRQFQTFPLQSTRRWLDTHSEYYSANDPIGSGYSPPTYVARGLVEGVATTASPLSNVALSNVVPSRTIVYRGVVEPTDSLFRMSWSQVPGASGYWLHVYQFRANASLFERQTSGCPAPVIGGNVQDFFVGYVAAPDTTYKLGTPGATVLTRKLTLNGQTYYVRVTAVGPQGEVIAYMDGDRDSVRIQDPNVFRRWTLAAVRVVPKRSTFP